MHLCTFGALGAKVNEVSWLAQLVHLWFCGASLISDRFT